MDMDLLIELAVRAVKAYLEKEGVVAAAAPVEPRKALVLTKKELKQAVEGMYHNLNTLQSRSGKSGCPAA